MKVTKQEKKLFKAQMYIEKAHELIQSAINEVNSITKKTKVKTAKKRGRKKKGVK